jgi:plasmid stabilization system protein ParE
MDYKVILSPRAIQDLQEIVRYISFASPSNAEKFGMALIEKARSLRTFPERGRVVPEFRDQNTREIFFHSYRIVYRVSSTTRVVEISRFGMEHEEVFQRCDIDELDRHSFARY